MQFCRSALRHPRGGVSTATRVCSKRVQRLSVVKIIMCYKALSLVICGIVSLVIWFQFGTNVTCFRRRKTTIHKHTVTNTKLVYRVSPCPGFDLLDRHYLLNDDLWHRIPGAAIGTLAGSGHLEKSTVRRQGTVLYCRGCMGIPPPAMNKHLRVTSSGLHSCWIPSRCRLQLQGQVQTEKQVHTRSTGPPRTLR